MTSRVDTPWAASAAVGKSFCTLVLPSVDGEALPAPQTGREEDSFPFANASVETLGCGWMTFVEEVDFGAELVGVDNGRGEGLGFVEESGVGTVDDPVDDGRDHPGPVNVDG